MFGLKENLAVVDIATNKVLCQGGENVIISRETGKLTKIKDDGRDYLMDVYVRKPTFHRHP